MFATTVRTASWKKVEKIENNKNFKFTSPYTLLYMITLTIQER
jgi:hypothetical protein